ncbi:S-adenosylmethionine decarboxylase, partial [Francisella tularensis]|uniref:S-adenosylmethionine decarboxylase n=1 Tax=Francisella tularensis TaxID=263 RepID=UPI0023AC2E61|nr:adenosylmethionine decarboxylase [Francisella tularensis subsp. holarctica]
TGPEYRFAALDILLCGDSKPNHSPEVLESYCKPKTNNVSNFRRGEVVEVVN